VVVSNSLVERAEALILDYLQGDGCPCRFPRFRSVVKRDTSRSLGVPFKADDQTALIVAFERHAPLGERSALGPFPAPVDGMWQARCVRCTTAIERSSNEVAPGGWVDFLVIRRAPGTSEIGAPLDRAFRCRPLVPVGPGPHSMRGAAELYPYIDEDEWFAWLRARSVT
jgi:hypothetical protein